MVVLMSNMFWNGETYAIVKAMKATGNREGIIADWKEKVAAWAHMHQTDPNAAAVCAWLPHWQIRPFYTVEELAPMWPALAIAIGHTTQWPAVLKSPRRLEFELDYAGLPTVNGGMLFGRPKYYIVERIHHWANRMFSAEEFEQEMTNAQR